MEELIGCEWDDQARVDMASRREAEKARGEETADGVVEISVVGDGGWGKRSLGHSYDALTGEYGCRRFQCRNIRSDGISEFGSQHSL